MSSLLRADCRRSAILRTMRALLLACTAAAWVAEWTDQLAELEQQELSTTLISGDSVTVARRILTRWSPSSRCSRIPTGVVRCRACVLRSASDQMLPWRPLPATSYLLPGGRAPAGQAQGAALSRAERPGTRKSCR